MSQQSGLSIANKSNFGNVPRPSGNNLSYFLNANDGDALYAMKSDGSVFPVNAGGGSQEVWSIRPAGNLNSDQIKFISPFSGLAFIFLPFSRISYRYIGDKKLTIKNLTVKLQNNLNWNPGETAELEIYKNGAATGLKVSIPAFPDPGGLAGAVHTDAMTSFTIEYLDEIALMGSTSPLAGGGDITCANGTIEVDSK